MNLNSIDAFTRHYLIAALWSSGDEQVESLLDKYDLEDLAPITVRKAYYQCREFQTSAAPELHKAYKFYDESGMSAHPDAGSAQACAGHDFWLTRNGHGVGFWDRGMGELGDKLTALAKLFGEVSLYVGDDGKIYSI